MCENHVDLEVRLAVAEGQAAGYKAAVADLSERLREIEDREKMWLSTAEGLQDEIFGWSERDKKSRAEYNRLHEQLGLWQRRVVEAEAERDERVIDEEWRAKRIDIQKLRDRCEQMRKNLVAVDARADERAAEHIDAIYSESQGKIAAANDAADERIAKVVGATGRRIREIEAEAASRIARAEAAADAAAKIAADAAAKIAVAERKVEMSRLAGVHRVNAIHEAAKLIFLWDARNMGELRACGVKNVNDVVRVVKDVVCKAGCVNLG